MYSPSRRMQSMNSHHVRPIIPTSCGESNQLKPKHHHKKMNLSKLSRKVTAQIGETQGNMFFMRLSPLQIMTLSVTREMEWQISKQARGKKRKGKTGLLFASDVRKTIESLYVKSCNSPYTSAGFWVSTNQLKKDGLLYVSPHKKGTSKRMICLTALGEALFKYPPSTKLFLTNEKQTTTNNEEK